MFLFGDIASIIILCLGALELTSYLFFSRSFSRVKKQIIDNIKFKNPLDSISLVSWIVLFILSILYSHNTSPFSSTFLSSGIALFFIGWLIRYPPYVVERTLRKRRMCRGLLKSYNSLWNKLRLYINNPDLYGPWLEIVGITIVAKSSIVYFPALFVFPIIIGASAIHKYRKLAMINPHTDFLLKALYQRSVIYYQLFLSLLL
jgi:protein-S-isoprenylcysteine O-methyltransferase Ste14